MWLLVLGCSSSPLSREAGDDAVDQREPAPREEAPEPPEVPACRESLSRSCRETYEYCLAKDANGCANLDMCFRRCTALSCARDCGAYWAISPEARDYYACLADGFEACFSED